MPILEDMHNLVDKYLDDHHRHAVREGIARVVDSFSESTLPHPGERAAVTVRSEKVVALLYDRVWSGIGWAVPPDIAFRGQTAYEFQNVLASSVAKYLLEEIPKTNEAATEMLKHLYLWTLGLDSSTRTYSGRFDMRVTRNISDALVKEYGVGVTPIYHSEADRDREFRAGDRVAVVALIRELAIPSENTLTWEQVVAVRRDKESRDALRRMTHWLDAKMAGKSWSFIEDEIAVRLAAYEIALRKHGIQTVLGAVSSTLDSKIVLTGSVASSALVMAGEPFWAAICGSALVAGKIAVEVAKALLDHDAIRNEQFGEVAFVATLKKEHTAQPT